MIDQGLKAFMEGPVMIVMGTRNVAGGPAIARGLGVRLRRDGQVEVVVSRTHWSGAVAHLRAGDPIAVTVCRPSDYEAFQIKGAVTAIGEADTAAQSWSRRYTAEMSALLMDLGVTERQVSAWLCASDPLVIRFEPTALFIQTPGPGAGRPLVGDRA